MNNYFQYNDPIRIIMRDGSASDPYVNKIESQRIINNVIILTEIPDEFTHVSISGYTEIYDGTPSESQFIVDYTNGIVTFHSSKEGVTITNITYKGRGFILYSASRIYGHSENPDVLLTLQDIIDNGNEAIAANQALTPLIAATQIAKDEAITQATYAQTQGDYAKAQGDYSKGVGDSLVFKGTYSAATSYVARNIVYYNGITYMAISATTGVVPTNTTYWKKMGQMSWKGVYSTATTYTYGDIVTDLSAYNLYFCIVEGSLNQALTNTSYWNKIFSIQSVADAAAAATTAANTAKTNADTATTAANTAKTNADIATANANTATTNANTATTNANTAATNANTKADYAQDQGDYAKDVGDSLVHKGDYSAATLYVIRNLVYYNGSTYMCILNTTAGIAPTNTTYWRKIVAFNWKGTYSAATTYQYGDFVIDATNQKLYMCVKDATLNIVLTTTENWNLLVDVSAAITSANTAITEANTAKTNADTATTNANTATTNANVARDAANTAAAAADAAKTNADTATENANTATTNANTAATNANTMVSRTTHLGAYSAATTYYPNNMVSYLGSSYICIAQALNKLPTDTGFWRIVASKGADGSGTVVGVASANGDLAIGGTTQNPDLSINTTLKTLWADKYTKSEVDTLISQVASNVQWKAAVANFAALATTYPNPQDGWTVNVNDTDYTYRYTGSAWVAISANSIPNASGSTDGKMTIADFNKLAAISVQANKTSSSATNGNILIDGAQTVVYTHPTGAGNNHIPTGGATGNFLKYSASGIATWATPTLSGLTETLIVTPTTAQVLRYNGTNWVNAGLTFADIESGSASSTSLVTNLNADMLEGFHATNTATAVNSIPVRDGNAVISANRFQSMIATGTSPLIVTSTTVVTNFNADMVDGYHTSATADAWTISVRDSAGGLNANKFNSYAAQGIAPFYITSTTVSPNLNADLLDGQHANSSAVGNTIASRDGSGWLSSVGFNSTAPQGSSPMYIASTTVVVNLNAELHDGYHASEASVGSTVVVRDANQGINIVKAKFGNYTIQFNAAEDSLDFMYG